MIKLIKSLFNYEQKNPDLNISSEVFKDSIDKPNCDNCTDIENCRYLPLNSENCDFIFDTPDYVEGYNNILVIDDNPGVSNFLKDDLNFIREKYNKDINIITISGRHAVFKLETILLKYKIDCAIIDITFGGSKSDGEKIIKLNGVDAFEMLKKQNPNLHYLFYTGNNLNSYVNSSKKIMDRFRELNGDDIKNHIIFKTSLNMDDRRELIHDMLFNGKKVSCE